MVPDGNAELEGYEIIDLKGQYLMPGLVNLHVHIPASGKPQKKPVDAKKSVKFATSCALTRKYLKHLYKSYVYTELLSGVTTMRCVGGVENYDTWIRDMIPVPVSWQPIWQFPFPADIWQVLLPTRH